MQHKADHQSKHMAIILSLSVCTYCLSEFNTVVDIELHKWAESLQLASLCADVGMTTLFEQLHGKLTELKVKAMTNTSVYQ